MSTADLGARVIPLKPTKETAERLKWALALAAKGFKILELQPGKKEPREKWAWSTWATTDPDKIRAMFEANPAMNYGVNPGRDYGIIDLDKKMDCDGTVAFGALEIEHGVLPETFKVRTRNGGTHLYLRVSEEIGNANKGFGRGSGIDVRGSGGYVVGPACHVTSSGWGDGRYTHVEGDLDHIAQCPEWVQERFGAPAHKDPKAGDPLCTLDLPHNLILAERFLANRDPAISGKNGNDWTWETVVFLRDFGLSAQMAHEMVLFSRWNLKRCIPEWDAEELATLVHNGWEHASNRPGCKRSALSMIYTLTDEPVLPENYLEWTEKEHGFFEASGQGDAAPTVGEIGPAVAAKVERRPFKLRSEAEQDAQPDIKWLIESVLQEKTSALFYGPENSLKSFLVLDLVLSAAAGRAWASYCGKEGRGGYTVERPLTVIYVAGEGSQGVEKLRRPAWRSHHGINSPLPFYTVNEMPIFRNMDHVNELIAEIEAAEVNPDIIVIDTMARALLGLNENSAQDIGLLIEATDKIKHLFECSVIAVHHTGYNESHPRGSTANQAAFDARFKVKRIGKTLDVVITNEKQKDAGEWSERVHFTGQEVEFKTPERVTHTSLVFTRIAPSAADTQEGDPRLALALKIIAENKGKISLSMNALADAMAHRYATEQLTDGELEKAKEGMRNYLKKAVTGGLAPYAHKSGAAKNAPWVFEDRSGRKDRPAA